jgi:hypothetical protein
MSATSQFARMWSPAIVRDWDRRPFVRPSSLSPTPSLLPFSLPIVEAAASRAVHCTFDRARPYGRPNVARNHIYCCTVRYAFLSVPSVSSAFSSSMFAYVKENQREGITWREHWENSNWESLAELTLTLATRSERKRRVARTMARGRKFVFEAHPSRHTARRKCMRVHVFKKYMQPHVRC